MLTLFDDGFNGLDMPSAVALGNFDGVHLGHKHLISQMLGMSMEMGVVPTVCTFSPHPEKYYGSNTPMISTQEQKLSIFSSMGVRCCFIAKFDAKFAALEPTVFLEKYLVERLQARAVIVGDDYHFGKNRAGNTTVMKQFCGAYGIALHVIPRIEYKGTIISSSLIRKLVAERRLDEIPHYLGRYISCIGEVIHGDKLGAKLGFPTANLRLDSELTPPNGVYAGYVMMRGFKKPALIYSGKRPTITNKDGEQRFEVNIINENLGDLYGEHLEVFITNFLRGEEKFASTDLLKEAMENDRQAALSIIK